MIKVKVGDIVQVEYDGNYTIPPQRVVAVFPMRNLTPDRVDVTDADAPPQSCGIGIPIARIKKIIKSK